MYSEYFIFNGVKSSDMGVLNISVGSNTIDMPLTGDISINGSSRKDKAQINLYGVEKDVIEFEIQISLLNKYGEIEQWTPQQQHAIGKWLFHTTFKEFQTSSDLGKIYYAICTSNMSSLNPNRYGHINLTFQTNSPYAWSPVYIEEFNLFNNNTTKIIQLENKSNVMDIYRPKIEIQVLEAGSVQLKNMSNGGKILRLDNLAKDEIISIDCENRIILSSVEGSNPLSKFNNGTQRYWLDLLYGINNIEVTGKCKIMVKSQFQIAQ